MNIIQHNEETFEGKNGIKLFSQSWTPAGKKRATLIIVATLHDHSSKYAWMAEELARQGYAVYGLDPRGIGKSEGKPQWVESFNDYLEDLDRFVKLVRSKETNIPLFIFGWCMSGNIVASYALSNKTGIAGAILSSPSLKNHNNTIVNIIKFFGTVSPSLGIPHAPYKYFSRDMQSVADVENDPLISKKRVPVKTLLGMVRAREKLFAEAEKFDLPLLLMHGTADKIVDPEGTKSFYERVGSADKTLKLYEGFYHALFLEPEKQTVLNDMSEWLKKHS